MGEDPGRNKITADGGTLPQEMMFIDEGISGATLVRPELERLRDTIVLGGMDRVYLLSPDRLARKYAHQALLLEEIASTGVAVHFLNHEVGASPEEELLLQMQGMILNTSGQKLWNATGGVSCTGQKMVALMSCREHLMAMITSVNN